jgi:hypothetical protein
VDVAAGHSAASGENSSMVLYPFVALTDFHQARKMEFHPGFDLARRNVITTRFQTLRQLLGTAEHPHRLAADIHLEKKRGNQFETYFARVSAPQSSFPERNIG